MALQRSDPQYYGGSLTFTSTTTAGVDFGFVATYVRMLNTCDADAYVKLSNALASCSDFRVRACSEAVISGVAISGLCGYSTGAAGVPTRLNVTALGGGGY